MNREELRNRLVSDLRVLELPIDEVTLVFRPVCLSFYGRYYPSNSEGVKPKLVIYPFRTAGEMYDYNQILDTTIHEMIHHIQYSQSSYERVKGVMHNEEFWNMFKHYARKARKLGLLEEFVLETPVKEKQLA